MQKWNNPGNKYDYWMFQTKDEKGNSRLGGGMMKHKNSLHTVTNYITISSSEEYTSKIKQAGGKVIAAKTEIPNMGYFAIFLDSENNMFGIYE